jgi:hypothetical protein
MAGSESISARSIPPPGGPQPKLVPTTAGRVIARLTSLDTGETIAFYRGNHATAPSEHTRELSAQWDSAGVAQASPQFIEYRETGPEERTYKITFDAHGSPGGVVNHFERQYAILKRLISRVPGKKRAHKLVYSQGVQRFRCVLTRVSTPVRRVSTNGGAMQAIDVAITLKEIPGGTGGPG